MKKILILEDDLIVQKLYNRALGKTYALNIVSTIADAKNLIGNAGTEFDLFVSDMRLPDGLGTEAVNYCQAHRPAVPIFVVSGTIADAEELTVTRKFEKPFSPEAFAGAIEEACN